MKYYHTYFLPLLYLVSINVYAKPQYVFQSENPIANFAWDENDTSRYEGHYRYEQAYKMIEDMLSDKRPLDFAEAVFAVENCMYDGQLNHSAYLAELERIASGVQRMALSPAVSAPTPDVALNYAIYLFYTQACPLNNYHPFEYDKMSLIEDVGLTGGMVTNLLKTGMGTCHSLPYLYKIIADKVGAKAYIALAPLHLYIRHQDAEGKWWNYETTTGTYSRSSFIMESFHVNENAIRSGLYMTNLTNKETVVQCLFDLLCVYERKTGFYSNDFVRKCYTLGLQYHYADNLHSRRIGDLEYQMKKKAWNKGFRSIAELRNDPVFGREYDYIQQQIKAYEEMGFYAYTQEEYMQKYQETLDYNRTNHTDNIRKWLSVDPLADKYPNISPYAYCGWNPVKYVDPDGREWIVGGLASEMQIKKNKSLSQTTKNEMLTTTRHLERGMAIRGKSIGALDWYNVFELFAHGNREGTGIYDKFAFINSPDKLYAIFERSPYLSAPNSHSSVFILYSCYAGNGKNSIARQLSGIKEVSGSVVISATAPVAINEKGNEYVKDGGNWNVFYKGKQIMTISGEEGAMTRFVQSKLKGEGLEQFLKQCEQQYKNIDK